MITGQEKRLAEFVNRTGEITTFCKILDKGDPPVMIVWGGPGLGKSSLLAKMIHETSIREMKKSEVVWTDTRNHDCLAIMRKIRDDVGAKYFNPFTDLINFYTVPQYKLTIELSGGSINVAQNATIAQSQTGDIAGIIIKDLMIAEPRKDLDISAKDKVAQLTDSFIANFASALREVAALRPLVIFFDAVEKMTIDTQKWVWDELLPAILESRLPSVRLVMCGRLEPSDDRREIKRMLEITKLDPLSKEHIIEYLEKRGIEAEKRDDLATMLLGFTRGNPLETSIGVDSFLKLKNNQPG